MIFRSHCFSDRSVGIARALFAAVSQKPELVTPVFNPSVNPICLQKVTRPYLSKHTMGHTIDILRDKIAQLRTKSTEGRYFLSRHDIHTLLTKRIIAEAIKECVQEGCVQPHQETCVVDRIANEGKIIFGILIWRKWLHKLMKCIEHDALDSQLPLEDTRADEILGSIGWDFARNTQWEFLPRMLTGGMSGVHSHFRKEEILPYISEKKLGEGSFGNVFEVSVFPLLQHMLPKVCFPSGFY